MRKHSPFILVISGPSGVGKSTVLRKVMEGMGGLWLSVSTTTRPPRPGEVDGVDYFFVSEEEFKKGIERSEFAEWAIVFGHRYGTPKKALLERMREGLDVVLEIDTQGARQIKEAFGTDCITVFIAPPSIDELWARLSGRGTEDTEDLTRRLENARREMEEGKHYDYWVINDTVDEAALDIISVIRAERCRRSERFS
ncbi:MAG: guanylate kinase [candidate division WOR-3 bacterium]